MGLSLSLNDEPGCLHLKISFWRAGFEIDSSFRTYKWTSFLEHLRAIFGGLVDGGLNFYSTFLRILGIVAERQYFPGTERPLDVTVAYLDRVSSCGLVRVESFLWFLGSVGSSLLISSLKF